MNQCKITTKKRNKAIFISINIVKKRINPLFSNKARVSRIPLGLKCEFPSPLPRFENPYHNFYENESKPWQAESRYKGDL
jgi:hypothetical protein